MSRWDPRLRVLLALLIGGVVFAVLRGQDGSMRLALSELAAVPLFFALWLGASGLSDLFGSGRRGGADADAAKDEAAPGDAPADEDPR